MFTEGKFQGSGCIVNTGLTAPLAHTGQRHHIPTGASELNCVPEAITPRNGLCPSFSLINNRNYPANPFRKYILQKMMMQQRCERSSSGQSCGKAPASKEQVEPGSKKLKVCTAGPDFQFQMAAATGGSSSLALRHQEPQCQGADGANTMGSSPPSTKVSLRAQPVLASPGGKSEGGNGNTVGLMLWVTMRGPCPLW